MNTTKLCIKCQTEKTIDNYPKDSAITSGYKAKCKSCYSNADSLRYLKKQELIKNQARSWYSNNKVQAAQSKRNRLNSNIQSRLGDVLRSRLNKALKRSTKTGSAVADLGCSIDELKTYLESKFKPGMTWENYGRYGWHIDHVIPISLFDLSDSEQLKKACNYANLQPMWAKDNWSKGAKWL